MTGKGLLMNEVAAVVVYGIGHGSVIVLDGELVPLLVVHEEPARRSCIRFPAARNRSPKKKLSFFISAKILTDKKNSNLAISPAVGQELGNRNVLGCFLDINRQEYGSTSRNMLPVGAVDFHINDLAERVLSAELRKRFSFFQLL